ncbi:tryptophan-rich sensory protein [Nostocoides australiense]
MSTAVADQRRSQILVSLAAVVWAVGTAVGMGILGDGVSQQSRGLFSDHATLIAPHGPAFSIWSVIYVGLLGYVIRQWLPRWSATPLASTTRVPAAWALALNGIWLLVVQAGWVWVSVVVRVGLVVSLGILLDRVRFALAAAEIDMASVLAVPVTFGLYLGWICVATCANVASALVGSGVEPHDRLATILTIVVLAVVVAIVFVLGRRFSSQAIVTALSTAAVWGLAWIAVARFTGELRSTPVAWTALVAAALVALAWALRIRQRA